MTPNDPVAQSPSPDTPKTEKQTDFFRLCAWLYAVYAISIVMECWSWTVIPGSIAPMAALALAYAYRKDAQGTPYESHLQWIIRTFWIGGAVYLPLITVIATGIAYSQMDWGAIQSQIFQGKTKDVQDIMSFVMEKNYKMFMLTSLAVCVPFGLWWLWRCWQGYEKLKDHKPMENIERWY